jgi:hypothetical protein
MWGKPEPKVDYEALLQASEELREIMGGLVAGLVSDGWSDEQAREIVMNIVVRRAD